MGAATPRSDIETEPLDAIRCLGVLVEGALTNTRSQTPARRLNGLSRPFEPRESCARPVLDQPTEVGPLARELGDLIEQRGARSGVRVTTGLRGRGASDVRG